MKYSVKEHSFSPEAKVALEKHDWPGNIRELISVSERLAILTDDDLITADDVKSYL
jgi:two-component system NtrC family response regulator